MYTSLLKTIFTPSVRVYHVGRMAVLFYAMLACWMFSNIVGCASMGGATTPEARSKTLEQALAKQPNNPLIMRDLAISYFDQNKLSESKSYLDKVMPLLPNDPKVPLYQGLIFEKNLDMQNAADSYKNYTRFDLKNEDTKLMYGRYMQVSRELLKKKLETLAQDEAQGKLTNGRLDSKAIAVFPLNYLGTNEQYAPLGRGIAAMIISDLGEVGGIKLLERAEMQVLLDEIAQGESGYINKDTAPKAGRILGAGRVIGGNYNVPSDTQIGMDAGYWDVVRRSTDTVSKNGAMDDLFKLEKKMVFDLLNKMNAPITPEKKQSIETNIPTNNFQAFLKFSKGLELEDRGLLNDALGYYRQAVALDPSFRLAGGRLSQIEAMVSGGLTWQNAVSILRNRVDVVNKAVGFVDRIRAILGF
jgi:tetratricopeptide (TPR) repeat protein